MLIYIKHSRFFFSIQYNKKTFFKPDHQPSDFLKLTLKQLIFLNNTNASFAKFLGNFEENRRHTA